MMEQKRFDFILRAAQPIAHHQETFGNTAVLMRQRIRQPDGSWVSVPIVTGDTMRHGLREAASYALLSCAGLLGEHLSEAALRLLFAGGMISGSGSTVRLDQYREMVELIPPLALLGGCAQNRVIPGRMFVDPAVLICSETRHQLPEWVIGYLEEEGSSIDSSRSHVEEVQRVRMDPTLDPGKRKLLTTAARSEIEGRMLDSEAASSAGDFAGKNAAKSSLMPRRYETVCAGSLFYWSVTATCLSELDVDTLTVMVATFLREARVGGKRGTGHGLLAPITARNVQLASWSEKMETLDLIGPDQGVGRLFEAHIQERSESIRTFLEEVSA